MHLVCEQQIELLLRIAPSAGLQDRRLSGRPRSLRVLLRELGLSPVNHLVIMVRFTVVCNRSH